MRFSEFRGKVSPVFTSSLVFVLGPHLAAGAWTSAPPPQGPLWGASSVWVHCPAQTGTANSSVHPTPLIPRDPVINPLLCFFIQQFRSSRYDKPLQELKVLICFYCFHYLFVFLEGGKAIGLSHFLCLLSHSSLKTGCFSQKLRY